MLRSFALSALLILGGVANAQTEEPHYAPEPEGYWTGAMNAPVPETLTGGKVIRVAELETLLKHGNLVIIDVSNKPRRPEGLDKSTPWLPLPQQVIPQSLWIPGAGMGTVEPAVERVFRKRLETVTGNNPTFPIVIYCHERCWLSWNAAKRAVSYGYRNVYWFPDGIEGWKAAGHLTVVAEPVEPKRAKTGADSRKPKDSKPAASGSPNINHNGP
jgi:PQQ-dependent catabolism-associated CXXCW motif protein